LAIAMAMPRSRAGNQLAMMRAPAGTLGAEARPTMKRIANMVATAAYSGSAPISPCVSVKKGQSAIAPV
jgi:hypothetical protein